MAETVRLNDGSMEVIFTPKDVFLERLLREKLGDDAARCLADFIAELKDELERLERSEDYRLEMCREALDNFSEVLNLLDAPCLDREALKEAAQTGYDDLYRNL